MYLASVAIEEGVNHLTTLSALQLHPWPLIVADEDATAGGCTVPISLIHYVLFMSHFPPIHAFLLRSMYHLTLTPFLYTELHVKTVKYFKSIERVQDEVEAAHRALAKGKNGVLPQVGQMD